MFDLACVGTGGWAFRFVVFCAIFWHCERVELMS